MKVTATLSEILNAGHWDEFCQEQGWSEWAVNEGGGHIEVTLTKEEAERYGLL